MHRVPFLFATNGRPYLRQLRTKSGIWFLDARRRENHPVPLEGWYTPEGLVDLLRQNVDEAYAKLIRERVHIYASLGDVDMEDQSRVRRDYGLDIESLPRGVLVGTVVIIGCRPLAVRDSRAAAFPVSRDTELFAWLLGSPRRAKRMVKPKRHPQPVWFTPF